MIAENNEPTLLVLVLGILVGAALLAGGLAVALRRRRHGPAITAADAAEETHVASLELGDLLEWFRLHTSIRDQHPDSIAVLQRTSPKTQATSVFVQGFFDRSSGRFHYFRVVQSDNVDPHITELLGDKDLVVLT